jgi:hypothetical protein
MNFDNEQLKLLAAALGLVISSVTVQFTIATFVNKVRDEFGEKKKTGGLITFSERFDWFWGYALGIVFNIVFFIVAGIVEKQTASTGYAPFGLFLWWLYFVNLVLWVVGMIIDGLRIFR